MGIKHAYQTVKSDDPASDVSANEWNADHVITGPLALAADPAAALDAATKQYVDAREVAIKQYVDNSNPYVGTWTFNTATTGPAASGEIRLNNAAQDAAT